MADALAEIYRNTLTASDFDSNGEATIVTTDSSTSHVIKNIQAVDTDTNVPISGTLNINDFDIVGLTANSSGSEVIAPSSTVKVKTSAIPLNYEDVEFTTRRSSSQYATTVQAKVNNYTALDNIYVSNNSANYVPTASSTRDVYAPNIGSNNYHMILTDNYGSTANKKVYNDSGTEVFSQTQNYTPAWWDNKQYFYYYGDNTNISGASGNGINRVDVTTGTATRLKSSLGINGPGSDPKFFGGFDANGDAELLFMWAEGSDNSGGYVYNITTGSFVPFTNASPNNTYGTNTAHNNGWYAVRRSTGAYRFVVAYGNTEIRYYDWNVGDVHTSSTSYTSFTLSGSDEHIASATAAHAVVGSKFYYLNQANTRVVAAWDFDPDTPTHSIIGSGLHYDTYGRDLTAVIRTPSSSTISGRSYGVSPSLKLRVTGITST